MRHTPRRSLAVCTSLCLASAISSSCARPRPPSGASTAAAATGETALEPAAATAFVGATVWDGTGAAPLPDAVVILERDRIAAVGARGQVAIAVASWRELPHLPSPVVATVKTYAETKMNLSAPVSAANAKRLSDAGVTVVAGSDAGNIGTLHGTGLHAELRAMADAGIDNQRVLLGATRDAARAFNANPLFGTLQPGKLADLLVVEGNPLADLRALEMIRYVVKGGVIFAPADLLAMNPEAVVDD